MKSKLTNTLAALLLLLCSLPLWAETVHLRMPSGIPAQASFHAGNTGQGAVLLLHGFLQAGDFSTLQQLHDELAEAGYTVLAPTITLGIPDRHESLGCGSLHLTEIGDEVAEVQAWVTWLKQHSTGPIYLLGHSHGARLMVIWASRHRAHRVRGLLAVSLTGGKPSARQERALRHRLGQLPPTQLVHEPLSFCPRYTAPAAAYLGYLRWDDTRVLRTIAHLRPPVAVILGGADPNLPHDWVARLRHAGARVTVLPHASHFMNSLHQFALLDWVLAQLKAPPGS